MCFELVMVFYEFLLKKQMFQYLVWLCFSCFLFRTVLFLQRPISEYMHLHFILVGLLCVTVPAESESESNDTVL
jgi:hypothetical protein